MLAESSTETDWPMSTEANTMSRAWRDASGRELQRTPTNHILLLACWCLSRPERPLQTAGPSILLVYLIIGSALFLFMRCGEILSTRDGTFADIIRHFPGLQPPGSHSGYGHGIKLSVAAITGYGFGFRGLCVRFRPATALLLFTLYRPRLEKPGILVRDDRCDHCADCGWRRDDWAIVECATATAQLRRFPKPVESRAYSPTGLSGFLRLLRLSPLVLSSLGRPLPKPRNPTQTSPQGNSIPCSVLFLIIRLSCGHHDGDALGSIDKAQSPFVTMFSIIARRASLVNLVVLYSAGLVGQLPPLHPRMLFSSLLQAMQLPLSFVKASRSPEFFRVSSCFPQPFLQVGDPE